MQKMKKTVMTILFLAILTIPMAASIIPSASAHTPSWTLPTYAFINIAPAPIGVGQTVNVNMWLQVPPPTAAGAYGDRWVNMTVKVTHPDGTVETLGPFTSDDTGGTSTRYTPSKVGNYSFQLFFGGEILAGKNTANGLPSTNAFVGDYFAPSQSNVFRLSVQEEPISYAPTIPLPTEYWTRPIYAQNNDQWYQIGGNWLGLGVSTFANTGMYNSNGNYAPYTTAANSAHIMWTKPVAFGGTMGGEYGNSQQSNYWSTSQYQPKFAPIIIQGILYYTKYPGSTANPAGWEAVNLHTGETLWTKDTRTVLKCGQIMDYLSPNEFGGRAYLWSTGNEDLPSGTAVTGTTYNMYDAMTGKYVLSIVNGTGLSFIGLDEHGGLIGYYINGTSTQSSLTVWNSTKTILRGVSGTSDLNNAWQWRPTQDGIYKFQNGIEWSVPIATKINNNSISLSISGVADGVALLSYYSGQSSYFQGGWYVRAGYSSVDGHLLWGPFNHTEVVNSRVLFGASSMGYGTWVEFDSAELTATGYSLTTGNKIWGPTPMPNVNPFTSLGQQYQVGPDGAILTWTYGGDAYSIDMATGKFNWEYHSPPSGYESPYGTWPFWTFTVGTVADGKLFIPVGHMYSPPLFHHAQQLALNLTDGSVVWSTTAFDVTSAPAISDGIMTTLNAYDNQLYAWGKGPVQMSVTAPSVGVSTATPMVIRGTVMDISAGASQEAQAARFPNGLPCVSEESQNAWMEYVYMQQPRPTNTTGVQVSIDVIDSNGNYRNIGTTTSDASGMFTYTWIPDISGDYTVIANFAGSESYYAASAETSFYASEPAATPTPQPTQAPSMSDLYFLPAIAGLFVAIIICIAMVALVLMKKP
jgi:hypothetical protein